MIELMKERRKYSRHHNRLPVQYKNMKALSGPLSGALTKDISEGGLRFVGNEFLSLANRMVLTIALPAPSRAVKVICKVAWIRKVPMGDQFEIGSQFLTMSDEDEGELKGYIDRLNSVKEDKPADEAEIQQE